MRRVTVVFGVCAMTALTGRLNPAADRAGLDRHLDAALAAAVSGFAPSARRATRIGVEAHHASREVANMAVPHAIADVVLPDIETVIAAVPADLVESEDELAARVRLAYAYTRSTRDVEAIEAAIGMPAGSRRR